MTKQELINFLPLAEGCAVVSYDDKLGLFAVDKAVGVKSHPNSNKPDPKAVLHAPFNVKGQYYEVGEAKVHVLHRIDSPTSGVLLLCLRDNVAKDVRQLFKDKKVEKTYYAVVKGKPNPHAKVWKDRITKSSEGEHVRVAQLQGGLPAETHIEFVSRTPSGKYSLILLFPKTGRTHQLRIQCALRKHPIVGDKTYGDFDLNKRVKEEFGQDRLFLHASQIFVPLRKPFDAASPLPVEFDTL